MNTIDKLIEELCPDGVEYVVLGNLGFTYGGLTGKTKADFGIGNARYVSYMNIFSNLSVNLDAHDFVKVGSDEKQNVIKRGDVLFAGSSETSDEVGMTSVVTRDPDSPTYLNSFSFGFRLHDASLILPDFAKYLFRCEQLRKEIVRCASGVTRFNLSKKRLLYIPIPLPPLPIQHEIVKILDTFSQLEAELEAELEARRLQYRHYRDELLTFGDGVEWRTLGEVCRNVSSGGTPSTSRSDYYGGSIPWLRTQEVDYGVITSTGMTITESGLLSSSAKWIPANCVIVAMYGATAAKAAINAIPMTTNQACCNLEVNDAVALVRYVYHWICKEYDRLRALGEGSQSNLNAQKVKSFPIPIPPLSEQQRIVDILDKFDVLVNDLSSGLPAEIAARRQQYEHYRDRLLTFKEKERGLPAV